MDKLLLEVFEAIGSGSMLEFLPLFVRQLLRKLPSTRRSAMVSSIKELIQYTLRQAEEHKQSLDNNYNRDFIDGYLKKIKEHENEPTSYFTRKRMCPGEILSFVEIFLYITNVLQKYRILPEENEIKGLNSVDAVIQELEHYKLRFVPR
ncbi:hypothetical protein MTO96_021837 [Rhipicephalus appendiculatus]